MFSVKHTILEIDKIYLTKMSSLDFLHKDLIGTYHYSNANNDRFCVKYETVNGRRINIEGEYCATTFVGLLYRVYDASSESYKNIMHVGIAHQDKTSSVVYTDEEYEKAYENALMDPQIIYYIDDDYIEFDWGKFTKAVLLSQPNIFVMTDDEIRLAQDETEYGKKYPDDYKYFNLYRGR